MLSIEYMILMFLRQRYTHIPQNKTDWICYFSHCYDQNTWQEATLKRKKELLLPYALRHLLPFVGGEACEEGAWGSWSDCIYRQEGKRNERWCSASFFHFIQFRTPTHEMVPPTFRVGLPPQLNITVNTLTAHTEVCLHRGSKSTSADNEGRLRGFLSRLYPTTGRDLLWGFLLFMLRAVVFEKAGPRNIILNVPYVWLTFEGCLLDVGNEQLEEPSNCG